MVSPELIVIRRWTRKRFVLLIIAILLILLVFSASGYWLGINKAKGLSDENQQLTSLVDQLRTQGDKSRRQLVMQKQINKVDQAANFHVGNSMDSQLQEIRELRRKLNFFRSIIAPDKAFKGLQISGFSSKKMAQNIYNWQLSLIQAGSQGRLLSGVVTIELIAMRNQEKVIIALTDTQKQRLKYRFKYFQHLSGTIVVADDLIPLEVKVVVKSSKKGKQQIEKLFPWQADKEKMLNVE